MEDIRYPQTWKTNVKLKICRYPVNPVLKENKFVYLYYYHLSTTNNVVVGHCTEGSPSKIR